MAQLEYQQHNIKPWQKRILPVKTGFVPGAIKYKLAETPEDYSNFMAQMHLTVSPRIAIDLETTGLNCFSDKITLVVLTWDGNNVLLLPQNFLESHADCLEHFVDLLGANSIQKTFHNAKFDMKFLAWAYFVPEEVKRSRGNIAPYMVGRFRNTDCTQVMRSLLTAGLDSVWNDLESCAEDYLNFKMDKEIRKQFIRQTNISREMLNYAAIDGAATWHIYPVIRKYLEIEQQTGVYDHIERPLTWVVAKMELNGIGVDVDYLKKLQAVLEAKIEEAQLDLEAYCRTLKVVEPVTRKLKRSEITPERAAKGVTHVREYPPINVRSSKQITELLHNLGFLNKGSAKEVLEQPPFTDTSLELARQKFRPDMDPSMWQKAAFEVCAKILEVRKARTAHGNFVVPLQSEFTDAVTGKIHCTHNQNGAGTGRFTHKEPNLAQMPKPDEKGVFGDLPLRRAFILEDGWKFIVFDYDACELRILAEITKCKALCHNISLPDPHAANAALIYGKTPEECGKGTNERDRAKNCIYLKSYGGGVKRLAATAKISIDESRTVMKLFDSAMPEVPEWSKKVQYIAVTHGYSQTLSGRKRYYDIPDMKKVGSDKYEAMIASIGRQAGNHPIQGTNADITKLAMVWVDEVLEKYGGKMHISVHDELVCSAPAEVVEDCAREVGEAMLAAEREFLFDVESKIGGGWGDAWDH